MSSAAGAFLLVFLAITRIRRARSLNQQPAFREQRLQPAAGPLPQTRTNEGDPQQQQRVPNPNHWESNTQSVSEEQRLSLPQPLQMVGLAPQQQQRVPNPNYFTFNIQPVSGEQRPLDSRPISQGRPNGFELQQHQRVPNPNYPK